MYFVEWTEVATDALLEELRSLAGTDLLTNEALRPVVAAILGHTGGLPVADEDWREEHRTAIGRRLLHEALGHVLRRSDRPTPGYVEISESSGVSRIEQKVRVGVNSASTTELEALPVLGPSLTDKLISERRRAGAFDSAQQLGERISGLGDEGLERLSSQIHFFEAQPSVEFSHDFAKDFSTFLARWGDGPTALTTALEALATQTGQDPHPATRWQRVREDLSPRASEPAFDRLALAGEVVILDDESYLTQLTELLSGASSRVDVAMFYIAMPGPGHPTRTLMEQLASAKARGVVVRVLVDRDRDDDPYGSSLINADAVSFLAENGIQIRVDAPDRLLHSKFVVADEAWAVLGSHNWTAGSYYRYHDSSIALIGGEMPKRLHQRFDALWQRGEVP
ncbi:MAG: phospholipase D-like domain-containing protein [Myxococcota bacterium]